MNHGTCTPLAKTCDGMLGALAVPHARAERDSMLTRRIAVTILSVGQEKQGRSICWSSARASLVSVPHWKRHAQARQCSSSKCQRSAAATPSSRTAPSRWLAHHFKSHRRLRIHLLSRRATFLPEARQRRALGRCVRTRFTCMAVRLAHRARISVANWSSECAVFTELATQGADVDFQALGAKTFPKPKPIDTPPFYAAQFFPLTRKSMGGIDIDTDCRVLDTIRPRHPGLFAVGEVTGFAGINGKAALEGTFLGPGIYMGRLAGRRIAQDLARPPRPGPNPEPRTGTITRPAAFDNAECLRCHDVAKDVTRQRPGYWHYEQSHARALSRQYECFSCHTDLLPYWASAHRSDRAALVMSCRACHGVRPREGSPLRPGDQ